MPTNSSPDDFDDSDPFADESGANSSHVAPNHEETERRMNIHRLKNEANELAGDQMSGFEADDAPSEILEEFWENVVAFERAPQVTTHKKLEKAGIEMPADTELSDEEIHTRLWQIIHWLARNNTVLENTNHLSDRELYVWLRDDWFHERGADAPSMTCHTSPIGSYGPQDMVIYHRYYADEESRMDWAKQFPEDEMPPRETLPFDRDRFLPDSLLHEEDRKWRESQRDEPEESL